MKTAEINDLDNKASLVNGSNSAPYNERLESEMDKSQGGQLTQSADVGNVRTKSVKSFNYTVQNKESLASQALLATSQALIKIESEVSQTEKDILQPDDA